MKEIVETVTGYQNAINTLKSWAIAFNESNGQGRMTPRTNLLYCDNDGSGEYYQAVCLNLNEAKNSKEEIYNIISGN